MDELTVYGWRDFWLGLVLLTLPCALDYIITWLALRNENVPQPRMLPILTYVLLVVAGGGLVQVWCLASSIQGCKVDNEPQLWAIFGTVVLGMLAARFLFRCSWPAACWLAIWASLCAWLAGGVACGA